MKLNNYLASRGIRPGDFGNRIGVTSAAVSRYASGARIPGAEVMRRIVAETEGAVTPNDFYDVEPAAHARRATTAGSTVPGTVRDIGCARWRDENSAAIVEANEELARNGLWSDGLRLF